MLLNASSLLGLVLLALAGSEDGGQAGVHSITVEQQVIMRIPVRPRAGPTVEWRERNGPRCIGTRDLAAASLSGPNSIDFVYRNHGRYRAELDDGCDALDFYGGFYIQPSGGEICARRDVVRSRMGGMCRIERIKTLKPRIRR